MFKQQLRQERHVQYSGEVNLKPISKLKNKDYYIINIPLDGDAPKQYIKAYFYYKNCPRKKNPLQWHGFFAKFGKKSYPHESIVEFLINKIGESLDLNMNKTRLSIVNGQIRFLSQDFRAKDQRLIHGIEILGEYFEDRNFVAEINKNRKERRNYLTFDEIEKAINHVYPSNCKTIIGDLVKVITFDAIVGNNDRHFSNWGVIYKTKEGDKTEPVLSPIYDTARALLWNKTEVAILKMYQQYKNGSNELEFYIKKSKPRFSFVGNPKSNHFEFIEFLAKYKPEYKAIILHLISEQMEERALKELKDQTYCYFSKERSILMGVVLKMRFEKLRKLTT